VLTFIFSAAISLAQEFRIVRVGPGLAGVKALSEICRTSLTATAIRYGKLGEDPVVVIVSSDQKIEYAFVCPTLKQIPGVTFLRNGDPLPDGSATARFNRDRQKVERAAEIQSSGVCQLAEVRLWFHQIASALDHAHSLGIVHRDIKPQKHHNQG